MFACLLLLAFCQGYLLVVLLALWLVKICSLTPVKYIFQYDIWLIITTIVFLFLFPIYFSVRKAIIVIHITNSVSYWRAIKAQKKPKSTRIEVNYIHVWLILTSMCDPCRHCWNEICPRAFGLTGTQPLRRPRPHLRRHREVARVFCQWERGEIVCFCGKIYDLVSGTSCLCTISAWVFCYLSRLLELDNLGKKCSSPNHNLWLKFYLNDLS